MSLHNIRYQLGGNGDKLFKMDGLLPELVGTITPSADRARWEVRVGGYLVVEFADESAARRLFAAIAEELQAGLGHLTIKSRRKSETLQIAQHSALDDC